ncbi:hypothetical protein MAHJHV65_15290 [Mycobacterium avium subsp. hominissuis]
MASGDVGQSREIMQIVGTIGHQPEPAVSANGGAVIAFGLDRLQATPDRLCEVFIAGNGGKGSFRLIVDDPLRAGVVGPEERDVIDQVISEPALKKHTLDRKVQAGDAIPQQHPGEHSRRDPCLEVRTSTTGGFGRRNVSATIFWISGHRRPLGVATPLRDTTNRATTYSTVPTSAVANEKRKSAQSSAIDGAQLCRPGLMEAEVTEPSGSRGVAVTPREDMTRK